LLDSGKGGFGRPCFWRSHGAPGRVEYTRRMSEIQLIGFDADDTLCTGYMQCMARTWNISFR
jgi:hypothetical protein